MNFLYCIRVCMFFFLYYVIFYDLYVYDSICNLFSQCVLLPIVTWSPAVVCNLWLFSFFHDLFDWFAIHNPFVITVFCSVCCLWFILPFVIFIYVLFHCSLLWRAFKVVLTFSIRERLVCRCIPVFICISLFKCTFSVFSSISTPIFVLYLPFVLFICLSLFYLLFYSFQFFPLSFSSHASHVFLSFPSVSIVIFILYLFLSSFYLPLFVFFFFFCIASHFLKVLFFL